MSLRWAIYWSPYKRPLGVVVTGEGRRAKVRQDQVSVPPKQDILGFDIAMYDTVIPKMLESTGDVHEVEGRVFHGEGRLPVHYIAEGAMGHQFEEKVDVLFVVEVLEQPRDEGIPVECGQFAYLVVLVQQM